MVPLLVADGFKSVSQRCGANDDIDVSYQGIMNAWQNNMYVHFSHSLYTTIVPHQVLFIFPILTMHI
jgi:hypothetical protein